MSTPYCAGCRSEIGVGKYITANNNNYHPNCYKCDNCSASLVGISFALNERNVPICTNCAVEATKRAHPNSRVDVIHSGKPSTINTSGPVPPPREAGNYSAKGFCSQCGTGIGSGGRFCSQCGNRV